MNKEQFLGNFMNEVWNKKGFDLVEKYIASSYTIHLDTADPWEG